MKAQKLLMLPPRPLEGNAEFETEKAAYCPYMAFLASALG